MIALPLTSSYGQEWKDLYHFNPAQTLNKLKFLNDQTGFTAGSLYNGSFENIHITQDGGKSWTNANSGYTSMRFMDIFIQDKATIFMSGNEGIIIRSVNGGASWQTLSTGTTEQLWGIHFLNSNLGFAVGSNGTIIRSTNGGSNWENIPTGINNLFFDVYFTNRGVGFASGSNVLFKTIDTGANWFPVFDFPFEAPADWIRSIKMVTENVGYACADIGRIYKTIDGGDHWVKLSSGVEDPLFDIDFVDEQNGMICGFNGTILKTNDGGQNWIQLVSPLGLEHLYSIDMISKDLGYICTHRGHILKLDLSTGATNVNSLNHQNFVYPNPCANKVTINLATTSKQEVKKMALCDLLGNCLPVIGSWEDDHKLNLNLDYELSGLYLLHIFTSKQSLALPLHINSNTK